MMRLVVYSILLATILAVASSAFLSDGVKEVHFKRAEDGSNSYDFEYETDNGKTFRGKTVPLLTDNSEFQLLFGPNDVLYWVSFETDEIENKDPLWKTVRLVERGDDSITMRDDFIEYSLTISKAFMFAAPYQTTWNLTQICFSKSEEGKPIFNYTISATNNSRKYNGTTYLEADDPLIQIIHLDDGSQRNDFYRMKFTCEELNSNETFCREITEIISQTGVLGARPISNIDPNALKSLVG